MKIDVTPADTGGCGWYRLRHPVAALNAQGHDNVRIKGYPRAELIDDLLGTLIKSVRCHADVLVLQRPLDEIQARAIPVLQRQGTAVVVEIDDDFHHLPKGHPARVGTSVARNPRRNRDWLKAACEAADLVTVSTPALADVYGTHGRVAVLPNLVPDHYLDIVPEPHDGVRVGWTGSTETHVGDLEVTEGGVAEALAGTDATLYIVGTGAGVAEGLAWDGPMTTTGWVDIDDYPATYAGLDAAIVPLAPNRFNEAKSWLKGLEAAALGVPFVASPTGPYRRLAELGAGLLAEHRTAWATQVHLLATDAHARADVAARGRHVAEQLTYSAHAWRWLEAWETAVSNHRNRKRSIAA